MATNYNTETFDKEHMHFGGTVYYSDFNYVSVSDMVKRIELDLKREQKLQKNKIINKNKL